MRYPSITTLQRIKDVTPEDAERIRHVMRKYHFANAMQRIDSIINTCGVEYLTDKNGRLRVAYCNAGDTYATTVCYNLETSSYSVRCWGDWVEAHPARYA
jgi:hypothetical protein